jgi:hypothetical protein
VEILSRTNPLWVLRTDPPVPPSSVLEVNTLPPPPGLIKTQEEDDNDLVLIEDLKSWFVSLKISSSVARKYAEILVENNTGRISKLQRKVEKNSNYLEEIGGFDEDDIADIKQGLLQLSSPIGDGSGGEEKKDFPPSAGSRTVEVINNQTEPGKEEKLVENQAVAAKNGLLPFVSVEDHHTMDVSSSSLSGFPGIIIIWDAMTGKSLNTIQLTAMATSLDWSPDDTHIAVCEAGNHLRTFSISFSKHSV